MRQNIQQDHSRERPGSPMVWLGRSPSNRFINSHFFSSVSDIINGDIDKSIILIDLPEPQQNQALTELRHNEETFLSLILTQEPSLLTEHLANGRLDDHVEKNCSFYRKRCQQLHLDPNESLTNRLLSYFWLHPGFKLVPIASPEYRTIYSYPLLEGWSSDKSDVMAWLASLQHTGLLEQIELIDQIKYCPDCNGGYLNFVDSCPRCQNIELTHSLDIHCHACSQVVPRELLAHGYQNCPNCHSQLHHLDEQDRLQKSYNCHQCNGSFLEVDTRVHCFSCKNIHEPGQLLTRKACSFCLSEEGQRLARHGDRHELFALKPGECLSKNKFFWALSWTNMLGIRHKHEHLLLALRVVNLDEHIRANGEIHTYQQLDTVLDSLRDMLRVTDVCCNYETDTLLVLFPQTPTDSKPVLLNKLKQLKQQSSSRPLQLVSEIWTLPDSSLGDDVEEWLSEKLN